MQKQSLLLSICIPTYNRKEFLLELVEKCLSFKDERLEVVVTDNCSNDGTVEKLKSIADSRLRVIEQANPIPAYANMIDSIYNANGTYALYCNDRDMIFPDKLQELMNFLGKDTYSFVYLKNYPSDLEGVINIYEDSYASLMNHDYLHHPTGMIFNRKMMEKYTKKKYYQFVDALYTNDFLMMDILKEGKSAIYYLKAWDERPRVFKLHNRSGAMQRKKIYYDPEIRVLILRKILWHLNKEYSNYFSDEDLKCLYFRILMYFTRSFPEYKSILLNKYEMNHYGLETRFLTTFEMLKLGLNFHHDCLNAIYELINMENLAIEYKKYRKKFLFFTVYRSMRTDFSYCFHRIKAAMGMGD